MLDLVKGETERIDARWSSPAAAEIFWSRSCNASWPSLRRNLAHLPRETALRAAGADVLLRIELLPDNIAECRANMLAVFAEYLNLTDDADETYRAAFFVLSLNLVHGDAMTMRNMNGAPISVMEWGYLGKGKFQRRDFRHCR